MKLNFLDKVAGKKACRPVLFHRSLPCRLSVLTLCCIIMIVLGCSTRSIKQYVRKDIDVNAIKSVAVLPLRNFSADSHGHEKIRSKIGIELLSRGIDVIEPGEIVLILRELRLRPTEPMRSEHIVDLGNMLNADAVLTGSVEEFGISKGISVSYPEVSVHLMMHDTKTGNIIWSVGHSSGGASFWTRHFGAEGSTLDSVSEKVIKEAFDTLYEAG